VLQQPRLLMQWWMVVFGDLKRFKFYHWSAMPAFLLPLPAQLLSTVHLNDWFLDTTTSTTVDEVFLVFQLSGYLVIFKFLRLIFS
jgi:hypothetical protein